METDILNILEEKSEDSLTKETQKLLRILAKKATPEKIAEQIEIVKQQLDITTEKTHYRVKEIYYNHQIDEEKLEFALKLIKKDKEVYKELEEIKRNYRREKIKTDLEEITKNLKNTTTLLNESAIKLAEYQSKKEKTTILSKIKNKIKKENKTELETILDRIIEILDKSKEPLDTSKISENYYILKDEYYKQKQLKDTIDRIYKKCKTKEISELYNLIENMNEKTNEIQKNIEKQLKRIKEEKKQQQKEYDDRLTEYVYDKKKNYISHSIDHSETNKSYKNILIILKLISELEKGKEIEVSIQKKDESKQEKRKIR